MIERIKSVVRIKLLSLTVELTKRMPRRWYGKDDKTKMKYQSFTKRRIYLIYDHFCLSHFERPDCLDIDGKSFCLLILSDNCLNSKSFFDR